MPRLTTVTTSMISKTISQMRRTWQNLRKTFRSTHRRHTPPETTSQNLSFLTRSQSGNFIFFTVTNNPIPTTIKLFFLLVWSVVVQYLLSTLLHTTVVSDCLVNWVNKHGFYDKPAKLTTKPNMHFSDRKKHTHTGSALWLQELRVKIGGFKSSRTKWLKKLYFTCFFHGRIIPLTFFFLLVGWGGWKLCLAPNWLR